MGTIHNGSMAVGCDGCWGGGDGYAAAAAAAAATERGGCFDGGGGDGDCFGFGTGLDARWDDGSGSGAAAYYASVGGVDGTGGHSCVGLHGYCVQ